MSKIDEYSVKLLAHIQEIFEEDCDNHIDKNEFLESENISCDKTTLFRSGELLIDEVVKGLILNSSL